MAALTVPVVAVMAYGASAVLKLLVREERPCQGLHVRTIKTCPAPGDWSFPSNHATVSALAMAASRIWAGAHYPHDVMAGCCAAGRRPLTLTVLSGWSRPMGRWITSSRLPLLVTAS
ncbi:hypothetical protein SVIOM342S_10411 [Streptomyces violaceorubidus]